ncbi:MAG TPA: ABC transporter substrate-binding protein [Rheinheimera sp.]|uniref:ABC transporter substrate-binding protein n=1 Tax=Rheinheimera sp. TaxID=1869214 RepID=UPI002B45DB12|nr:ABC transporter substrate-binding protein [Rheinheimera sp.]HJS14544.1 ABC transporter substrate-binding protein [Rheinheimera sp.]
MGNAYKLTRRQFLQLCVATPLLITAASACGRNKAFSLGIYQHPGHEAFYLSEHFNLLPAGVTLRSSRSADTVVNAMMSGELDAATLALDEVLLCLAAGIPLQIILVLANSCGAHTLLSRPDFSTAADLKGKIIALEPRAATELLLEHYLVDAGLTRKDVEIAYLPQLKQLMAWENGQIDAAINSPPVSHYIERTGAKRLFDGRQCAPQMFQVLAVRTDRIDWLNDIPARLLNSYYLGLQQLKLFAGDSMRRTALWRNLTLNETHSYFASVDYPTAAQNLSLLCESGTLHNSMQQLMAFMPARTQLLQYEHKYSTNLFDTAALRQLVLLS